MEHKVNLHEILQLNKRLNHQDEVITKLQNLCSTMITAQTANKSFSELFKNFETLTTQIDEVRRMSSCHIDNRSIGAGELATINYGKIQELISQSQIYVRRTEFDQKITLINHQNKTSFEEIYHWATPLDFTHKLQDEHKSVLNRIHLIENILPSKIDRSELNHIESLTTRIELYSKFKDKTIQQIEYLESSHNKQQELLKVQQSTICKLENDLKKIDIDIRKLAPKTEIRALAKDLNRIEKSLEIFATKSNHEEMNTQIKKLQQRISDTEIDIQYAKGQLEYINKELPLKAIAKEVTATYVRRVHFEEIIQSLGRAVDTKATETDVNVLQMDVKSIQERLEQDLERISVAMRFIEWFTSRGETYEHNLRIIDKHLTGLAKNALPDGAASMQPFSGQIRFSPYTAESR
eukprot:gene11012-23007_t